jgi:hypothetical protein
MSMHVIYRLCDKVDAVNGLPRPFGLKKKEVIQTCFTSLIRAFSGIHWSMTILADDISQETREFVSSHAPANFDLQDITEAVKNNGGKLPPILPNVQAPDGKIANSNYIRLLESNPPLKNEGSILRSFEVADTIQDDNSWVFFLEDDYLLDAGNFMNRFVDFLMFADSFKFALPIFVHPSDYPDQYTRLLSRNYIFQTRFGYWREVSSTTFTFLAQVKGYKHFAEHFKSCAVGANDGKLSSIFKKDALCFSPLPGLAAHMHEGVMSNYINWEGMVKDIRASLLPADAIASGTTNDKKA